MVTFTVVDRFTDVIASKPLSDVVFSDDSYIKWDSLEDFKELSFCVIVHDLVDVPDGHQDFLTILDRLDRLAFIRTFDRRVTLKRDDEVVADFFGFSKHSDVTWVDQVKRPGDDTLNELVRLL